MENLENKEISLKPLSKGLGFYDPLLFSDTKGQKNIPGGSSVPGSNSHSFMLEKLDLEDLSAYEQLLISLEKPYLGTKKSRFLDQNRQNSNTKTFSSNPDSSSVGFSGNPAGSFVSSSPSATNKLNQPAPPPLSHKTSDLVPLPSPSAPPSPISTSSSVPLSKEQVSPQKEKKVLKSEKFFSGFKVYLTDAFFISFLFFPPLIFFAFLTEPEPLTAVTALWPKILTVFFLFAQVYCFLCRLFCFETFGEAFARIRLFSSQKEVHPLRLFWRFLLSCLTGVVLIPLLSLIFRKDFMACLTGLYFQEHKKL